MSGLYKAYGEYKDSGVEWLGEIPGNWGYISISRMFTRIKRTGHIERELLSVYRDYGVIPKSSRDDNNNMPSEDLSPYQLVEINDLVMNKMKAWQGSIAISECEGIVSPAYFVYSPKLIFNDLALPKYIHYLLRNSIYITQYLSRSKGIRVNQWDLDPDEFKSIDVLLPTKEEQFQIAAFLDHETAKIDTLIDKQQQLIELLIEKRQAVISHAVTKGLDPDVSMKDSGVEWLGEVPEHWVIQKIKWFATMKSGDFITSESIEIEDEFPVYGGNGLRGYSKRYTHDGKYVLIGRQGALCGNINYANGKFWASEHAVVVSPYGNNEVIWLGELFGFMNFNQYSFSAAQPGLAVERIKDLHIPIPPSSEQKLISRFLDFEIQLFESIKDKCNQSITLLQERRTALISAAVTGKIDVRDWQVPVTQTESDEVMA